MTQNGGEKGHTKYARDSVQPLESTLVSCVHGT